MVVTKVVAVKKARVVLVWLAAAVMVRGYKYEASRYTQVLARLPPLPPTLREDRLRSRVFVRVHSPTERREEWLEWLVL
jgi:hypothetical protein